MQVWKGLGRGLGEDVREMLWLASLVGALSVLGVGVAISVALVLDNWQTGSASALSRPI